MLENNNKKPSESTAQRQKNIKHGLGIAISHTTVKHEIWQSR